jgi:hypothetical protein
VSGPLVVPTPSSPEELSPQQSTIPEVRIAQKPVFTAARLVAWMPVETGAVLHELSVHWSGPLLLAPLPNSPKELFPQQLTIPEVRIAQYPPPSPDRSVAEIPTGTGILLQESEQLSGPTLVPSPS